MPERLCLSGYVRRTEERLWTDRLRPAVLVGGLSALMALVLSHTPHSAFSATPRIGGEDSLARAIAEDAAAARRTIALGVGGDVPMLAPRVRGRPAPDVSGDAVASLSSDQALAGAAGFANIQVRSIAPPKDQTGIADRVADVAALDQSALTALDQSIDPGFDADLARRLNVAFLEGRDRMAAPGAASEHRCLAEAVYFEARSEPLEGQVAVAEVVLNRVDSQYWPDTICEVVYQGSERRNACQFSYACDGQPETINNAKSWALSERVAELMMMGAPRRITGHATHYHADYVSPRWARTMEKTTTVGRHIFFRRLLRVARKPRNG